MELFTNFRSNNKKSQADQAMTEEVNKLLSATPMTKDTSCGIWRFKGPFLQRFANQTAYVLFYGFAGCIIAMTSSYFNGTLTTVEKRFKIPPKNTGIIFVGLDISQVFMSLILCYFFGKRHRPRWIGFGLLIIAVFCLLNATPYFVYGPGEDALTHTFEFGGKPDENATNAVFEEQRTKSLCRPGIDGVGCPKDNGSFTPQVILFIAQFICGIGDTFYHALGISYMDDNTKKTRTPMLLSLSYFLRMLGPAIGYTLASFCLRFYVAPQLRPVINNDDPRWLGAWWIGWLILGSLVFLFSIVIAMFPKELPRAAARRMIEKSQNKQNHKPSEEEELVEAEAKPDKIPTNTEESKFSFQDMMQTYKSLLANKTLMCNNLSSIFYLFGYSPYWILTPKYIEIMYKQSASTSSMATGTVTLVFSAVGILSAGLVISKYKPSARYMAAWNVFVGFLSVAGMLTYILIGCPESEKSIIVDIPNSHMMNSTPTCNSNCHCDYVPYSPICGENQMTYISPCHAGCKRQDIDEGGKKYFYDCACIPNSIHETQEFIHGESTSNGSISTSTEYILPSALKTIGPDLSSGGHASAGACPVKCQTQFFTFLAVMCCLKFLGSAGRASNFLVAVRCVPEKDKTASIGLNMMLLGMFAFIPSPIFFGWLFDSLCLVWGKTCTNKGNCWLYDTESLRYFFNLTTASFVTIGSFFDIGVWYFVKDLKIFDEDKKIQEVEMKTVENELKEHTENKT